MTTVPTLVVALLATSPPEKLPEPVRPLAEYARQLSDPDREKRLKAAEAIRDHYKGKSLNALPQIIEALGDELGRPLRLPDARFYHALSEAAASAGPSRVNAAEESTRSTDVRVRAAGFHLLYLAAKDSRADVDLQVLLAAVRQGLKDESPFVRSHAVVALQWIADAPPEVTAEAVKLSGATWADRVKPREGYSDAESPAVAAALVLEAYGVKAKPAFEALVSMTHECRESNLAFYSCRALRSLAKADPAVAEDVVAMFRSVSADGKRSETVREGAIRGLIGLGPAARFAIPDLVALLEDSKSPSRLRLAAITALGDMGARAAPAVPTLGKRLEMSVDEVEQGLILGALKTAGPTAVPATDALERYIARVENPRLRERAIETLASIKK